MLALVGLMGMIGRPGESVDQWNVSAVAEALRSAILDPSSWGESLGPELIANGRFDADIAGWTNAGGGSQQWVAGKLRASFTGAWAEFASVAGRVYEIRADAAVVSGAGSYGVYTYPGGGFSPLIDYIDAPSIGAVLRITATSATTRVYLYSDGTRVVDWDNVSVREVITGWRVPGTDGARLLGDCRSSTAMEVAPDGTWRHAAQTLLAHSDDLTQASAWQVGPNLTANGRDGSLLGMPAFRFTSTQSFNSYVLQAIPVAVGATYTARFISDRDIPGGNAWVRSDPSNVSTFFTKTDLGGGVFEYVATATMPANTTQLFIHVGQVDAPSGATFRVAGCQANAGPIVVPRIPTGAAARFAPAFDWRPVRGRYGVRRERASSNRITQSSLPGIVAGSPGTLPTNWDISGTATAQLTRTVGAPTTLLGLPAVSLRFAGTITGGDKTLAIAPHYAWIAMTAGQPVAESIYWRLAAGSMAGISFLGLNIDVADAGAYLTTLGVLIPAATSTPSRPSLVATAPAGTTRGIPNLYFVLPNGTYDFTLEFACPQHEPNSPVVTSPILTYGTEGTRGADVIDIGYEGGTSGTVVVEFERDVDAPSNSYPGIFSLSANGSSGDVIGMAINPSTRSRPGSGSRVNWVSTGGASAASDTTGHVAVGFSWDADDMRFSYLGGAVDAASTGMPAGLSRLRVGAFDEALDGWIYGVRALRWTRISNDRLPLLRVEG